MSRIPIGFNGLQCIEELVFLFIFFLLQESFVLGFYIHIFQYFPLTREFF